MSRAVRMPRYRTIWISDVHLGTRGCKAEFLLDFLRQNDAATIYLVGDIIDGWRLKKSWYWPQTHNDVVQKLLRTVRRGLCLARAERRNIGALSVDPRRSRSSTRVGAA
jgi:hypothetical protein